MLNGLKQKWKVNGWRLALIITTFAVGGSLTGITGHLIMSHITVAHPVIWGFIYILAVTFLWPFIILLASIPFGQFFYFRTYLKRIGSKMGPKSKYHMIQHQSPNSRLPNIAIFASGTGTNAEKIIQSVLKQDSKETEQVKNEKEEKKPAFRVGLIVCNKQHAGVLTIASKHGIPNIMIEKDKFFRGNSYVDELMAAEIDFIVLAGFLWKIPQALVNAYRNKIINIHPALLPKYGGKGMYGQFVHESVIANKDTESGITIHWVDEHYDHGSVIFQATCPVLPGDTPDSLAGRIHNLEHKYYPEVINRLMNGS